MLHIVDFIEQYRQYNLVRRFPKGTKVIFELPKDDRFKIDREKVDVATGWVYSHDDDGYSIWYNNEFIEVPYESVLVSQAEVDKFPITDSLLNSMSFSKNDNFNELAKKLMFTFPDATSDDTIDLCTDLQSKISSIGDDELQVFVFDTEFLDENVETDTVNVEDLTLLGQYGGFYVYYTVIPHIEE